MHVFKLREETRTHTDNPHMHRENMHTEKIQLGFKPRMFFI